jgi:hypothetical protein
VSQRLLMSIMSISSACDIGMEVSVKVTCGIGAGEVTTTCTGEICGVYWTSWLGGALLRIVSGGFQ